MNTPSPPLDWSHSYNSFPLDHRASGSHLGSRIPAFVTHLFHGFPKSLLVNARTGCELFLRHPSRLTALISFDLSS